MLVRIAGARDQRQSGFSLIEVMMVVAIIAILSAIVYPTYQQYRVRANRAAAQSALMDIANREQHYFIDARGYTNSLVTLGYTVPAEVSSFYTVAIPTADNTATPPAYSITATPISGTMQASDGTLTLTSTGTKTRGSDPW